MQVLSMFVAGSIFMAASILAVLPGGRTELIAKLLRAGADVISASFAVRPTTLKNVNWKLAREEQA